MAEQSINIPQVIVFIVVTFLAVRWYFSKPSASSVRSAPMDARTQQRNLAGIDQIAQMFPQLDRRDIGWDLQRNGGNIGATTERVLSGRGLDRAPPSFNLPQTPQSTQAPTGPARPIQSAPKFVHPDLITRYNLSSKLSQTQEPLQEEQPKQKVWSQDRNERQANLQKRREEMILAARRKMEEKEKAKSSGAAA